MSANLAALGYLVAAICFILALRGLSHPTTARQGNVYGMVGMALAVLVTLLVLPAPSLATYLLILVGVAIGGSVGFVIARRIQMTAMPQLVAAFHSLVGLAAVFVASAALMSPEAFHIFAGAGIKTASLLEMGLGVIKKFNLIGMLIFLR